MLDLNLTSLSFENYLLRPARAAVDETRFERVSKHEAARAVALALHDAGLRRALLRLWGDTHPPSAAAGTGIAGTEALARRWTTAMLTRPGAPLMLLRRRLPRITGDLVLQGAPPKPAPQEPKRDETVWLELEVLYDDESGASGSRYRVEGPSPAEGRLDRFGYAYHSPVDPGGYRAFFDDAPEEPPIEPGWIDIEVVDSSGAPRAGIAYQVKLSNGETRSGVLDPNGRLLLAGIPEGAHEIIFPKVDASSIEPKA